MEKKEKPIISFVDDSSKLYDFQFLFDVAKEECKALHVGYAGTTLLESDEILAMCMNDAVITYGGKIDVVSFNYQLHNESKKVE